MKHKQTELEVDFIGGGRPLTKQDEIAISNYIRAYKARHTRQQKTKQREKLLLQADSINSLTD